MLCRRVRLVRGRPPRPAASRRPARASFASRQRPAGRPTCPPVRLHLACPPPSQPSRRRRRVRRSPPRRLPARRPATSGSRSRRDLRVRAWQKQQARAGQDSSSHLRLGSAIRRRRRRRRSSSSSSSSNQRAGGTLLCLPDAPAPHLDRQSAAWPCDRLGRARCRRQRSRAGLLERSGGCGGAVGLASW
jgi:hypothetical protein